jgi:putative intracellular protease/amidase
MMKQKIAAVVMILPVLLFGQSLKPTKKKVLIVISSYGKNEGKQRPGFEFEEFSQAYLIFKANGLDVDIASPKGGPAEPDEYNKTKPYNKKIIENKETMALLRSTKPTAQLKAEHYAAVYVVGGKGAMFDLPFDPSLQDIISNIYQKQKGIVAAVCHGPAALTNVKLNDTTFLLSGKTVTGFCNDEEEKFGKKWKSEFPFMLEDKLKARGVKFERSEAMLPQVTVDGRLITGQNPYSTTLLAEETVKALGIKPVKRELYQDERSMQLLKRALKGDTAWARQEIYNNTKLYDTQLIAVYGYYKLIYAKGNADEITPALYLTKLVSPWVFNENLQYEMARGYLQLNNKEKAKGLLEQIMKKEPSFIEAKQLLDKIK